MLDQLQLEDETGFSIETKFLDVMYVACVKSESTTIGLHFHNLHKQCVAVGCRKLNIEWIASKS